MASSNLLRLSGLAALVAGGLFLIGDLIILVADVDFLSAESQATASYASVFLMWLPAGGLFLLGLVGLYVRQAEAAGVLGLVGFLVAFLGMVLLVGFFWNSLFITPLVTAEAPEPYGTMAGPAGEPLGVIVSVLASVVGGVLFGVATLRAGVYPRAAAIVFIVGNVLALGPIPGGNIVFDVAVAWLGFSLFAGKGAAMEQPTTRGSQTLENSPTSP